MTYIPVLILLAIGATIGIVATVLSQLLGPHIKHKMKDTPFECGMIPVGDAKGRFSVRFYLVAILFLLFDVEAIFFYPWAVVYKQYLSVNAFILMEMFFFVGILLLGYIYVLRKGALEWD